MSYQIEVRIRKIWSPLKAVTPSSREKACDLIMEMRKRDKVCSNVKFRIRPVDIFDLEEL